MVSGPANFAGESATRCQPKKFPGQKTPRESRKIANSEKEKKCSIKSSNFCLPHEQEYWKRRKRLFSSEKERDWTRQMRHYGTGAQRQQGCEVSEIMFRVLVHVSTCLLANFFSLCTALEAVA
jgi:hypothetical protein